jgi:hypothetical protein
MKDESSRTKEDYYTNNRKGKREQSRRRRRRRECFNLIINVHRRGGVSDYDGRLSSSVLPAAVEK